MWRPSEGRAAIAVAHTLPSSAADAEAASTANIEKTIMCFIVPNVDSTHQKRSAEMMSQRHASRLAVSAGQLGAAPRTKEDCY